MQKTHMLYDPIELSADFPIWGPEFSKPPDFAHVHNCFEIGFCWQGSGGVFQIGSKIYSVDPGCAVFINDREYHILTNATPENSKWDFINLDPVGLVLGWIPPEKQTFDLERLSGPQFRNIYSEEEAPELIQFIRLLMNEMRKGETCSRSCVRALVWAIFTKLSDYAPETGTALEPGSGKLERLYPALQHISQNYTRQIDIPTLAAKCNMSMTAFRQLFKKNIGMRPLEYVNTCRLNAAATLLRNTSLQIFDIAGKAGFPTLSHFNRMFNAYYSCSPWEYRLRNRAQRTSKVKGQRS